MGPDAVVLLQMGGPDRLEDVEQFLRSILGDPDVVRFPAPLRPLQPAFARAVARRRAPEVVPRYERIGGGDGRASPIGGLTHRQAEALSNRLGVPVHVAMRYTLPRAEDAVARLKEGGAGDVLLLPLYPQYSGTTTGSALRDFARAARRGGLDARLRVVRSWAAHAPYVEEVAACIEETASEGTVLLSAHSLPESYVRRGDPYRDHLLATLDLLRRRLPGHDLRLGFQSSVGPGRWLRPETDEHVAALAAQGVSEAAIGPLGFVTDHIETLYDLDEKYQEQAAAHGITLRRVPSLNDRPGFVEALADLCDGGEAFEVAQWTR